MTQCQVFINDQRCAEKATVSCGTWVFCTKHAIGTAHVTLDEDGFGMGNWGSAHAGDPEVIATIRQAGGKLMKLEWVEA